MISCQWQLSPTQAFDKQTLFEMQKHLVAAGIYLDLSWKDGIPLMTFTVSEEALEKETILTAENNPSESSDEDLSSAATAGFPKRRGRPPVMIRNDLTYGRVCHMRFMNISVEKIAEEIGVSKRTFYRKWKQAEEHKPDPNTPFSQWA